MLTLHIVTAFTIFCTSLTSLSKPLSTVKLLSFRAFAEIASASAVGSRYRGKDLPLAPVYRFAVCPSYLLILLFSDWTRTGSCRSSL